MLVNIILLVLVLGFIGTGFKDGFIYTIGRIIGAIIGFLVARSLSISVGSFFAIFMPSGWARFIAFLVIFILISRLVGFVFKLVDSAFKILSFIPFLKSINSFLGALLGIIEGIILIGGAIWVLTNFNLIPKLTTILSGSSVASLIGKIFNTIMQLAF